MKNTIIKIFIALLIFSSTILSQTEPDSAEVVQSADTTFVMAKSPLGAVGRSALIPGWGQYYTESYWKIPVIWGFIGYFISIWIDQNNLYKEYRDLYEDSIFENPPDGDSEYYRLREFYRDQRNEFAIYIGFTYFLNLIDAYVDAHMFDFDVSSNPFSNGPQMNFHLKIKL